MVQDLHKYETNKFTKTLSVKTASNKYVVPSGEIQGHINIYKFGRAEGVGLTKTIVWDGVSDYLFLTSNSLLDVSSTSSEDTMTTGTNAWKIRIEGLVDNSGSWDFQSEEIELDGLNKVTSTKEFIRVYRAYVIQGGDADALSGANLGTISIEATGTSNLLAQINPTNGQTLMCIYTTPSGYTALLSSVGSSTTKGQSVFTELKTRDNSETDSVFRVRAVRELYQNNFGINYDIARLLPEKTDILLTAQTDAGTVDVSASFEILLIKKDLNLKE